MIPPLPGHVISAIETHAASRLPEEICGLVVNGTEYVPMENLAENKELHFKFDRDEYAKLMATGTVTHIVHSHVDMDYPSEYDMQQQARTNLPWIICNISQGRRPSTFMWGHPTQRAPILGREFRHGTADCYALLRDFYKAAAGIDLPDFPREFEWWYRKNEQGAVNLFVENFEKAGFTRISETELRPFDVVIGQVYAKVPNHCGIYLGNDLILHHMYSRASRREPYGRLRSRVVLWLRYTKGDLPREISETIW